ncbi:hypothetical protein [Fodinibius halophilus]|uniref:Uncharacterized protein n=1 Tax=Fodinibius halophilus TaxID=1736908 RepID=A0A6M1SVW2_9BACT|nr:hypothetical protein [Fodinibius halophilus]NGP88038.1 hypothetical protein [Fodinibius halophilus]
MKNLTATGLRLIAIWALLQALGYIQFLPVYFTDQYQNVNAAGLGMLIVFLIYITAAAILFFKAPAIAIKMSGNFEEPQLQINNYQKFTAILFAAVGLLIFFNALETFSYSVGNIYNDRAMNPQAPNRLFREIRILLFGGGIQIILGAGLFVGGKKIANWWHNFRNWT